MNTPSAQTWNKIFGSKQWGRYPAEAVVREVMGLPTHGGNALDLGCGAGANTVFLAENGFVVDAVDSAREALHQAEVLCLKRGVHDNVTFHHADYIKDAWRPPESRYSLVLDWMSLTHQPKEDIAGHISGWLNSLSSRGSYILGLFGEASSPEAFVNVPLPSLFNREEVDLLAAHTASTYNSELVRLDLRLSERVEEVTYTRSGRTVQTYCLVFTKRPSA